MPDTQPLDMIADTFTESGSPIFVITDLFEGFETEVLVDLRTKMWTCGHCGVFTNVTNACDHVLEAFIRIVTT